MSMKAMMELRDTLCEELDDIARKDEMSAGDLEAVHKLTDTIKNIDKIMILDETNEYSMAGDWEAMGRGHFGDYDRGNSYARGERRDSRGRYSREGRGGRGGRRGYSRDGGDDLIEHVDRMMDEAETSQERELIKRFKKQLENIQD